MDPRQSRLQIVEEIPEPLARPAPLPKSDHLVLAGTSALLLGLKVLSQRALAAIDTWFMLLTVASAWWLWASIPDPNNAQLIALAIYALFILAANIIVRRFR